MSDMSVDPADLHQSGHFCNTYHGETQDKFDSAHEGIAGAVGSGWVGSSAEAMSAALETMRSSGDAIVGRLAKHADDFTSAAHSYQQTETQSTDTLKNTEHHGGLNL